jgi:hypothetical protein
MADLGRVPLADNPAAGNRPKPLKSGRANKKPEEPLNKNNDFRYLQAHPEPRFLPANKAGQAYRRLFLSVKGIFPHDY